MTAGIKQFGSIDNSSAQAACFLLRGDVQGFGVRPAIANLARRLGLAGDVYNNSDGVRIVVEGDGVRIELFQELLLTSLPSAAMVEELSVSTLEPSGRYTFDIMQETSDSGVLSTLLPRDLAVCSVCLQDVEDPLNRRHGYAFTSCTQCGPRYSIIISMPYERHHTGMAPFAQCAECRGEYRSTSDRRFHAQTNACPDCGPHLWIRQKHGPCDPDSRMTSSDAIAQAAAVIAAGGIVALRGLGGYQLIVDATNQSAVDRLRVLKRRPRKSLAVMIFNNEQLGATATPNLLEMELLRSPQNPIVVISAQKNSPLAKSVAPGMNTVGLMQPTTPLHAMLGRQCRTSLVVTSGNIDGKPLAIDPEQAEIELAGMADLWLHHNRPIVHAIDDSVVRLIAGKRATIRLARGLAPLSLDIPSTTPGLAVGGHQKVAIALSNGKTSVLGPHLGDMETVSMRARFEQHVEELLNLYGCRPEFIVCDLHPDYFTTRWAAEHANSSDATIERSSSILVPRKVIPVQHHHAHVAAAMVDHHWQEDCVLGVAFDGTGYGTDGTIWGGEFLRSTLTEFDRVGHLLPFPLPRGDLAIREPWRIAVSLLTVATHDEQMSTIAKRFSDNVGGHKTQIELLISVLQNGKLAPTTTSAGRLFDGVAALVLGIADVTYEGEAAMMLEAACDVSDKQVYEMPLFRGDCLQLDWRPAISELIRDADAGTAPGCMAMRFHRGLALGIARMCNAFPDERVVLAGGVFQNRILVDLLVDHLPAKQLGPPQRIPMNDGGLAAGQLAIGAALLKRASNEGG